MRRALWVVVALSSALFVGCGSSATEFQSADPKGYRACQYFQQADGAGGSVYRDLIGQAAKLGLDAASPEIRQAVDDRNGGTDGAPVIPDLGDFESACKGAGFDF